MDLTKLLKPKSVAVIGASEKNGFGGDVCRNIITYTKDMSRIYFVNPKRDTVFERKCYPSVTDIPDEIDLMIICTAQKTILPLLEEGAKKAAAVPWFLPAATGKLVRRKDAVRKKNCWKEQRN